MNNVQITDSHIATPSIVTFIYIWNGIFCEEFNSFMYIFLKSNLATMVAITTLLIHLIDGTALGYIVIGYINFRSRTISPFKFTFQL